MHRAYYAVSALKTCLTTWKSVVQQNRQETARLKDLLIWRRPFCMSHTGDLSRSGVLLESTSLFFPLYASGDSILSLSLHFQNENFQ